MKIAEMQVMLKERTMVSEDMYIYVYENLSTKEEIKIGKKIPTIKEVEIEGDNNEITLPVVPDKIVIKGSNNRVLIEDECMLDIPWFLTPEFKRFTKGQA